MRIAILGIKHLPAYAGADRVVEQLLDHLPPGNQYTVYLARDEAPELACSGNRRYVYIPALRGKHIGAFSYFALCCLHFLVRGDYHVAHVHNSDFGLFCPLLRMKRRVRVVGTFHGDPYERQKWSLPAKLFLRISEWIFARSCHVLTSVTVEKRVSGRDVHYIPNGIAPSEPTRSRTGLLYERFGVDSGAYLLFACGRLDRTKGLHHLLDAYRLYAEGPPLLAIGDFSHDDRYAREIEHMAASDSRVTLWKSLLSKDDLLDVVRASIAVALPSEVEAMSMMLLEAIGCRKAVICSDIPANVAIVGDDYPYLFRSEDSRSLAETLRRAIENSAREEEVRPYCERIVSTFSWDEAARAYTAVYETERYRREPLTAVSH